ncbi:hypothetical protein Rsub_12176 [Raphidocelis subcapitata]|uniref:Ubiquitin-like domain-containing protein n=1 Tax=Raphidocelis subcapitata TaxID=307507 RepID=A0A2V0PK28_9CHLO|nr:hypothetical protein Rsub_12176 [Raphidocelis subcapitata]|eukprot:GBF99372.1 hypothetical protein Rsub_12176 [Raphidocelis subcapitata]
MDLLRARLRSGTKKAAGAGAGPAGSGSGDGADGPPSPPAAAAASAAPAEAAASPPPPTTWAADELAGLGSAAEFGGPHPPLAYDAPFSEYNPTPGTGRTGFLPVPPNNYPFFSGAARYKPVMQADGGQLSEWQPMYAPTKEQAEEDRRAAYQRGVPHGYADEAGNRPEGGPKMTLTIVSELHGDDEYGAAVGADGRHSGGPFVVEVAPSARIEELRLIIRDVGGVLPALCRLSYAGKRLDDAQRTLEHYGTDA